MLFSPWILIQGDDIGRAYGTCIGLLLFPWIKIQGYDMSRADGTNKWHSHAR